MKQSNTLSEVCRGRFNDAIETFKTDTTRTNKQHTLLYRLIINNKGEINDHD